MQVGKSLRGLKLGTHGGAKVTGTARPAQFSGSRTATAYFLDLPLPFGASSACLLSPPWSPMTPLSGHTEKIGHFLQPATTATGHTVTGMGFSQSCRPTAALPTAYAERGSSVFQGALAFEPEVEPRPLIRRSNIQAAPIAITAAMGSGPHPSRAVDS